MSEKREYVTLDGRVVLGTPKFAPCLDPAHPLHDPVFLDAEFARRQLEDDRLNAHEWGLFPEKHLATYNKSLLRHVLSKRQFWLLRNPWHNKTHFEDGWGIIPRVKVEPGQPMPWVDPLDAGWMMQGDYFIRYGKTGKVQRKRRWMVGSAWNKVVTCLTGGIQSRGNWRMGTGNAKIDGLVIVLGLAGLVYAVVQVVS